MESVPTGVTRIDSILETVFFFGLGVLILVMNRMLGLQREQENKDEQPEDIQASLS
jgi:hypothetical protein